MAKNVLIFILLLSELNICSAKDTQKTDTKKVIHSHQIDSLMRMNRIKIRSMDILHLRKIGSNIPVFSFFTPQQKIQCWKVKLNEVKALNWSPQELRHIKDAEEWFYSHQDYFSSNSESIPQETDRFFRNWMEAGIKKLGWNKKIAYSIIGSLYFLKDTKGNLEIPPAFSLSEAEYFFRQLNSR